MPQAKHHALLFLALQNANRALGSTIFCVPDNSKQQGLGVSYFLCVSDNRLPASKHKEQSKQQATIFKPLQHIPADLPLSPQAFQSPNMWLLTRLYTAPIDSMFSKPWLNSSGGERSRIHLL